MWWTLGRECSGTLLMCGVCGDIPRGHVLCNTLTSPSGTIWLLSSQMRRSDWKKKKKSQNLDFNIDSDGQGEKMNLSPFLKVSLLLKWCNYQLIVCWHCSYVYCLSHQPPLVGLHVPQCALGWSIRNCKRMEWKN